MPKPAGRAGYEHPAEGRETRYLAVASFSQLRPVSQPLKVAVGMFVPTSDRHGLGMTEESHRFAA